MKIVSILAVALMSLAANARTVVYTEYSNVLGQIALENACVTATEVRTINPTEVCTNLVPVTVIDADGGIPQTDWVCKSTQLSHLSQSRSFVADVCAEYGRGEAYSGCVRTEKQLGFLPQTIKISVVTEHGEFSNFPGVQKSFTFPTCK